MWYLDTVSSIRRSAVMAARRDGGGGPQPGTEYQKLTPLIVDATGKAIYDAERHCRLARGLCLLGATDEEIAREFGVSLATYYRMRREHPELDQAIRMSKLPADGEVAAAVHKVSTGYKRIERRPVATKDGVEIV